MGSYETIDKLCEVTTMLADLVREQSAIIAQADIPDETKESLSHKWNAGYALLDGIEYGLRHSRDTFRERGDNNVQTDDKIL